MINCRYCNQELNHREVKFGGYQRILSTCDQHKPIKVNYKVLKLGNYIGDNWIISFSDYRLSYFEPMNRTLFQQCHPEAKSVSLYYELIKKFDSELLITPEQFPDKIKMLLSWS